MSASHQPRDTVDLDLRRRVAPVLRDALTALTSRAGVNIAILNRDAQHATGLTSELLEDLNRLLPTQPGGEHWLAQAHDLLGSGEIAFFDTLPDCYGNATEEWVAIREEWYEHRATRRRELIGALRDLGASAPSSRIQISADNDIMLIGLRGATHLGELGIQEGEFRRLLPSLRRGRGLGAVTLLLRPDGIIIT